MTHTAGDEESRSDEELLAAISGGDEAALAALYDRYRVLTYSLAYRVLHDAGRAEDVVQEAFLAVWRKASSFAAARGSARTWLATIVRNRALDLVRGRARALIDDESVLLALRDRAPAVAEQVVAELDRHHVRRALAVLPMEQRRALTMAYFDGLSHSEIAAATTQPLGTVKSRVRLGMLRLREHLLATGYEHAADGFPAAGGRPGFDGFAGGSPTAYPA